MTELSVGLQAEQPLNYGYLSDHPAVLPDLVELLYAQWGNREFCSTREKIEERLKGRMEPNAIPFTIVALTSSATPSIVGTASICLHELPQFVDRRYWLCEVCVNPAARGMGLGQKLVRLCQDHAAELGVEKLNLYTLTKAGFYERMNWKQDGSVFLEGFDHPMMSIELNNAATGKSVPVGDA